MNRYEEEDTYYVFQEGKEDITTEYGCGYCWDKRTNRSKELFFLDRANNMRVCLFCPNCGRKYI